ncbi:mucin-5B-like [Bombina bombina]|uniref:mucin-5B-like n=1 Tax=Bombina bombina TaxID=8345 RepID=UPI00235A5E1E|nr:mucin-5B-like [Bombina bombina]
MGTFLRIQLGILLLFIGSLNARIQQHDYDTDVDSTSNENIPEDLTGARIQQHDYDTDVDSTSNENIPEDSTGFINGAKRISVIPNIPTSPVVKVINNAHNSKICSTWGNFHFKNFDGDVFHFPGTCNYVYSSHCKSAYEDFNIQIRREVVDNVPVIQKIIMKIDGLVLQINHNTVEVNGQKAQLPFSASSTQIEKHGVYLTVSSKIGLVFMWNDDDSILLKLDEKYANQTCGLCGDYNSISIHNEFISNGVQITATQFGNLQKMDGPTEQCQDAPPTPKSNCTDYEKICERILLGSAFSQCHSKMGVQSYIDACVQDLCACESEIIDICLCSTFAEYSRQCAHAGGVPQKWRNKNLCPLKCPYNMVYQECASPCADTCSNPERRVTCEDHCREGCTCPAGTVFDDINKSGCVPIEQCSCTFNSETYAPGSSFSTSCSTCLCTSGKWNCKNMPCPASCSLEGGSHITTYDQTHYNIHGNCNYVLSKSCSDSGFTVLSELRKCGLSESETCLKSATVILNGGETIVGIKPCGSVYINGIYTQLPISAANVTIFRPSSFYIVVQTNLGVRLAVQLTPFMQLYVTLDPSLKSKTCGLCGNFNDKQSDDFQTINGVIEGTAASFANTWKTQANCPNIKNVYEDPCALSIENEQYAKHWCGLVSDPTGPFAACHSTVLPDIYQKNCMFDACNCEKTEECMCAALSSYVHACAAKGVILTGWRANVCTKYMNTCPKTLNYTYSTSTCQPTCRSLSEPDVTCSIKFIPVDGCTCSKDFYMDDSGKCVPVAECPCYYKGSAVSSSEVHYENGVMCTCSLGKLSCIGSPEPVCNSPMIYFDCKNASAGSKGAECQKSCQTLDMECYTQNCVSGCVCPNDLVSDGKGGCIKEEQCPCIHNDASYQPGEKIKTKCNTCTCKNRMWMCTSNPCLGTCAVYGDGHYITFDGKRYSFNGDCDYILAQDHCGMAGNSSTFRVITENIPCGTTGTTCSKAIKVFLGSYELILTDEHFEVIERGIRAEVPYKVRHMGIYLVIEANNGLILMWDRKTSIFIKLSKDFEGNVCGLCGDYDGNRINDFTTRSLSVVGDVIEFGNSWKLSPSCPDAKQSRDPCSANPYRKSWAQKQCSIINSAVFSACHAQVDPSNYYDACVTDSCACDAGGDCECFCTAIAAYAQACSESGICVSWRTPNICPIFCDYYNPEGECAWHYKPCGAPCMKTCRNPSGKCLNEISGLEGCYPKCPAGKPYFDEDEMECVSKCGCYDEEGNHYKPSAPVYTKENCKSCECTMSGIACKYTKEACHCQYNGTMYNYNDVIYNTTDGIGGCIVAICSENGIIYRDINPCKKSIPTTTPFTFTTTLATTTELPPETTTATVTVITMPEQTTSPVTTNAETTATSPETTATVKTTTPEITTLVKTTIYTVTPEITTATIPVTIATATTTESIQSTTLPTISETTPPPPTATTKTSPPTATSEITTRRFCHVGDSLFLPGEVIYNKTDKAGCSFYAICNDLFEIKRFQGPCQHTVTPTTTTSTTTKKHSNTSSTTPKTPPPVEGCPPRKTNETWAYNKCATATCRGKNIITIEQVKCPPVKTIACDNGFPPVKVYSQDGCCYQYECQCVCSGWGDPHYITFDGIYYTFLEDCTYVLVQQITPKFDNFRILVDNYFCAAADGLSCPGAILVYYKADEVVLTQQMIKGRMTNTIRYNNNWVSPGFTKNGISVTSAGINMVVEIPEINAYISFSGLIFVIKLPFSKFGYNTEGQCGTCSNNRTEDCRLPTGRIVKECSEMAYQWNVNSTYRPYCHPPPKTITPSTPTPSPTCGSSPLCDVIFSDVFAECHEKIPPQPYHEGCVYDACRVRNESVQCSSLAIYASLCAANGVCVDWRGKTGGHCPYYCPVGKFYDPCGPIHVPTCDSKEEQIINDGLIEGCYCSSGTKLFNSYTDVCVKSCSCIGPDGMPKKASETWISNCQECICEPTSLSVQCKPLKCAEPEPVSCNKEGFIAVQVPNPDQPCCILNQCQCNVSYCSNNAKSCPLGFEFVPVLQEGDCCISYDCKPKEVCVDHDTMYKPEESIPPSTDSCLQCICTKEKDPKTLLNLISCNPISCKTECSEGYKYKKIDDQCCGICIQDACTYTMDDNSTVVIKPGDTWQNPNNKCSYYECNQAGEQFTTVSIERGCTVYRQDQCSQGYQYEKVEGECCGKCVQEACAIKMADDSVKVVKGFKYVSKSGECCGDCVKEACTMKMDDNTTKILQPGETWYSPNNKCSHYECIKSGEEFTTVSLAKDCTVYSQDQCTQGYQYEMVEGECCGKCVQVACTIKMKDDSVKLVKPEETWSPPEDICVQYECQKIEDQLVPVTMKKACSDVNCEPGFKYVAKSGECCGECVKEACTMKMDDNTTKLLQPGETWYPPNNKCSHYECIKSGEEFTTVSLAKDCTVYSQDQCTQGYQYEMVEGECCGKCVQVACTIKMADDSVKLVKPGDTWQNPNNKCSYYECNQAGEQFTTVSIERGCTVYRQDQCSQGYQYEKVEGECCGKCVQEACAIKMADDSVKVVKPGETWIPPEDVCIQYDCQKIEDQLVPVTVRKACSNVNCEPGFKYVSKSGECCGDCVKEACTMKMDDNTTKILQPGETWYSPNNKCSHYECIQSGEEFTTVSLAKDCTVYSQDQCTQGYQYEMVEGECCGKCVQVACTIKMKDDSVKLVKPEETWSPPEDICVHYECQKIEDQLVPVTMKTACSDVNCEPGFKYVTKSGECCGECVKEACTMKMDDNTTKLLQPGETWYPPNNKCSHYECIKSGDEFTTVSLAKDCTVYSQDQCTQGYQYEMVEGECCGKCVQVACTIKMKDDSVKLVKPEETWSPPEDICVHYECQKIEDQLVPVTMKKACSDVNCEPGFKYVTKSGECCGECVKEACTMKMDDNTTKILEPGETWYPPNNKCSHYECIKSGEEFTTVSLAKDCTVYSQDQCTQGYQYEMVEGECCGKCVQVACTIKMKDGSVKLVKPEETWSPPEDICVNYECQKIEDQLVPVTMKKACSDVNCEPGFKYVTKSGECCGECVKEACTMKMDDNTTKLLQPGETWYPPNNKCSHYECIKSGEEFTTVSLAKDCTVYSQDQCTQGYQYEMVEGECCGKCVQVACTIKMKDDSVKLVKPEETWSPPEDICVQYECQKIEDQLVPVTMKKACSDVNCEPGFKYVTKSGECCGECVKEACTMKMDDNTTKILQPGETFYPPNNKCSHYECIKSGEEFTTVSLAKDCTVYSQDQCTQGYQYEMVEGECCGKCVQVACTIKMKDDSVKLVKPEETWTPPEDICVQYECQKIEDQLVPVTVKRACSDVNCEPGFKYLTKSGECCGECVKEACTMKMDDNTTKLLQPGETFTPPEDKCTSYTCEDSYQVVSIKKSCPVFDPSKCVEGTIKTTDDGCCKTCEADSTGCQVRIQSTRIKTSTCESDQTVELSYCEGACKTSSMYSAEANTMEHKCSCCQEMKTSKREVSLKCLDGTSSMYSYIYVEQCGCTSTECGQDPQTSQSQPH